MIHICAAKVLLPWLFMYSISGHPDGATLAAVAHDYEVPVSLMWAIAFEETRHDITNTPVSASSR